MKKGDIAYTVSTSVGGIDTFFTGMNGKKPSFSDEHSKIMLMTEDYAIRLSDLLNIKSDAFFEVISIGFE